MNYLDKDGEHSMKGQNRDCDCRVAYVESEWPEKQREKELFKFNL